MNACLLFVILLLQENKEPPVVKLAAPLGVAAGATTKVTLRGLKLDDAKEVKCSDGKSTAKVVGQGQANVPNMQNAHRVGDRQVEIELTVPDDAGAGELNLVVVTGHGESAPYAILIGGEHPVVDEKEANDGFRDAQKIAVPQIVQGTIHGDRNVDCYAIDGAENQQLVCEVVAARRGSGLDAIVSVYNERSLLIATNDDLSKETTDARVECTLPAAGKYFIVVQDAHDLGGPAHPYRLVVK